MCGIAGIHSFTGQKVTIETLQKMTDIIRHRGPDGEGHWVSDNAKTGFGHRRLSIVDLSENGRQPMQYMNRYTITFNGEIYNYIELRKNLLTKGYHFKSDSDTEVLLALYDQKKENCLQELDGMFSFAIWDDKENTLFCARDRFGEKPFHYAFNNGQLLFASEIKQLWAAGVRKEFLPDRVKSFLYTGDVDNPLDPTESFYKGIINLGASHYIMIRPGQNSVHQTKYWDISTDQSFGGTLKDASIQFLELLSTSIKLRMRADVPIGTSLSGGLDSSSIVLLLDNIKDRYTVHHSFSARFKDFDKDEGNHIQQVVNACNHINIYYTWPDREYLESVIDKVSFYQDEPYGSASIIAQYAVMELAKQHGVTVLLDGQGADEFLGGYIPYYRTYLNALFFHNVTLYRHELNAYNTLHPHAQVTPFKKTETLRMKAGRYKAQLLNTAYKTHGKALSQELKTDMLSTGLKTLLRYADRNSMAHSREVRLPFLSHRLVEFCFTLPDDFKLRNGWTKMILRESMKDVLPPSITWRKDKIGYEPPQKLWIEKLSASVDVKKMCSKYDLDNKLIVDSGLTNDLKWKFLVMNKFESL